ncbi:cytidylate kinase [Aliidongia dinghuensis]|uniref:Cytidylate kinase n=1 Tax=Aliidongia dinghuensis TaxID=1867774 RepID=A0A8J2Z107_9PROT|nr:(d)CMP kinase [Aliidongia dinghuensis]GGF41882.1 cytidylate kinase [Aliidongia dinghuensis]
MASLVIAVDGPAAAGKGTLARRLAAELRLAHLDTGALYRATARDVLAAGIEPNDAEGAAAIAAKLDPASLADPALRSEAVGRVASVVSAHPSVRAALLDYQRNFAHRPPGGAAGAVLDGRDVGTVVCPDATVKLFVTASVEARADRRVRELEAAGGPVDAGAVLADMVARDERDTKRSAAPLRPAHDAVVLDTSGLDADEAFEAALAIVRARARTAGRPQA